MILIDANLLLLAYNPRAPEHAASRQWLETTLSGTDLVRFAWVTLWAFLRISTNPRVFERPLSMAEAEAIVSSWLARPTAGIVEPGGRLVMDAVLAALAIEHGATLHTTDRDFARFSALKQIDPLSGS